MTLTDLLPPFRANLEVELTQFESADVIIIRDPEGIAESNIMLEAGLLVIINELNGDHTLESLFAQLQSHYQLSVGIGEVASFVRALDEACLLDSETYLDTRLFIDSDVRHSTCHGTCYPEDPQELRTFIDSILGSIPARSYPSRARAVLAPHIDFRVDPDVYAAPFLAMRDSEFDLVIHIGTSHYGWQDRFMLTNKDFITPLGRLRTDVELVEKLRSEMGGSLTRNDAAYQPEHALELHHVFIQHMFADREFSVLPVLVGSFADLVHIQQDPMRDAKVARFCESLRKVVEESGRKALWLVSGDLAHIGRRFGDPWDARDILDTLRSEDFEVMNSMVKGSAVDYFNTVSANHDRRRICGLPPVWTMLQSFAPGGGTALDYKQWDDFTSGSAVSFGSAAWW